MQFGKKKDYDIQPIEIPIAVIQAAEKNEETEHDLCNCHVLSTRNDKTLFLGKYKKNPEILKQKATTVAPLIFIHPFLCFQCNQWKDDFLEKLRRRGNI